MMEGDGGAMEQVPMRLDACPRDLLRTFMSRKDLDMSDRGAEGTAAYSEEEVEEEIELNLGLSLGGRFGIDKSSKTKLLVRSSSVSSFMQPLADSGFGIDGDAVDPSPSLSAAAYAGLVRTSSLPVETEEEWRKRKERQTLRRLAAKRRRSEKQRNNTRGDRDAAAGGGGGSDGDRSLEEEKNEIKCVQLATHGGLSLIDAAAALPFGLSAWSSAAAISRSAESQGGSSSAASESDCKQTVQGSSGWGEEKSVSIQLVQEQSYKEAVGSSAIRTSASPCRSVEADNSSQKLDRAENRGREIGMNAMQDMPCVFTRGDGPNGRRIEGILYKYGKGQEVRIMCVCHGKFLSPAEFVKHAGGSDVAHPLKHIVVNPPASFSSVL